MRMKFKKMILFLTIAIILSGCSLKLKTKEIKESEYHSAGNEMDVFGFGIGESMNNIVDVLGKPKEKTEEYYSFPKEDLKVYYQQNLSKYISTSHPEFQIMEEIHPGMHRETLINDFPDLDLFEYKTTQRENPAILLAAGRQKIVLEMVNNEIDEIFLASQDIPFATLLGLNGEEAQNEFSDETIYSESTFLSFKLDIGTNNKKALSKNLIDYAGIGLIEGVPLPIGTSKYELTRRFGAPNYIFEGEKPNTTYYYYKRFNLYLGFDESETLSELRLPVNLDTEEFFMAQGITRRQKHEYEEYVMMIEQGEGRVTEVIVAKKDHIPRE